MLQWLVAVDGSESGPSFWKGEVSSLRLIVLRKRLGVVFMFQGEEIRIKGRHILLGHSLLGSEQIQ